MVLLCTCKMLLQIARHKTSCVKKKKESLKPLKRNIRIYIFKKKIDSDHFMLLVLYRSFWIRAKLVLIILCWCEISILQQYQKIKRCSRKKKPDIGKLLCMLHSRLYDLAWQHFPRWSLVSAKFWWWSKKYYNSRVLINK